MCIHGLLHSTTPGPQHGICDVTIKSPWPGRVLILRINANLVRFLSFPRPWTPKAPLCTKTRQSTGPQSGTVPSPWSLFWILGPPSLWVAVRPVQSKQGLKPLALLWRCPWLLHQERQWQGTRAASTERLASCSTRAAPRALPRRIPKNRLR